MRGQGRESGVSPSGGGVGYKSCDAFVQPAFFLAGNCARNGGGQRHRIQKLVFKYFKHKDLRSWCAIVDLLVSEAQRERERRERQRVRINRRANEEDSSGKFMQYPRLVY